MKVAFVVKYFFPMKRPSGILNFVYELCEEISHSVKLTVYTYRASKDLPRVSEKNSYTIKRVGFPFPVKVNNQLAEDNPDIIIVGSGIKEPIIAATYFLTLSLGLKSRIIYHQYVKMSNRNKSSLRFLLNGFAGIICVSKEISDFFDSFNTKTTMIPPGVNISRLDETKEYEKTGVRIGYFGHFRPHKGPDLLLDEFIELGLKDVELMMAGEGPLLNQLIQKSKQYPNIQIKGFLEDNKQHIKSCDIVVFPFRSDDSILGVSQTLLEAMGMGKAVICSDTGCLNCIVEDNVDGLIFRTRRQLNNHMKTLIFDPELREKLGCQARKKIIKQHNIEKISRDFLRVLEEAYEKS
ncbi:MAG: glycosyltransferase [Candidatus Altiarchaeales archaeon]|nr:glycosyltransferase [Candidatus Altiarchaeales archaeon]